MSHLLLGVVAVPALGVPLVALGGAVFVGLFRSGYDLKAIYAACDARSEAVERLEPVP